MNGGKYEEARRQYEQARESEPENSEIWWGLVRIDTHDFRSPDDVKTNFNYIQAMRCASPEQRDFYNGIVHLANRTSNHSQPAEQSTHEFSHVENSYNHRLSDNRDAYDAPPRIYTDPYHEEWKETRDKSIDDDRKHKRSIRIRTAVSIVALVVIFVIAGVKLIVIPENRYRKAVTAFSSGSYVNAAKLFGNLNGYRDSERQQQLSNALYALSIGDMQTVRNMMTELSSNQVARERLSDEILQQVTNWKVNNTPPEAVLYVLQARDEFDPSHQLDADVLYVDAHIALLGAADSQLARRVDLNGDNNDELAVIHDDLSVDAYEMKADGNHLIAINNSNKANLLENLGDEAAEDDPEQALRYYNSAILLTDSSTAREKAAILYRAKADASRTADNTNEVLSNAREAFRLLDSAANFELLDDATKNVVLSSNLREGIDLWDQFRQEYFNYLIQYGRDDDARSFSGDLRLQYASTLAEQKDIACLDWFNQAESYGADVEQALIDAAGSFDAGAAKLDLRFAILDRNLNTETRAMQIALASKDIVLVLSSWEKYYTTPARVFNILDRSSSFGITIESETRNTAVESVELALAKSVTSVVIHKFVYSSSIGYPDLLIVSGDAVFSCLRYNDGQLSTVYAYNVEGFTAQTISVLGVDPYTVLLEGKDAAGLSGISICRYNDDELDKTSYIGLINYMRDEHEITYETSLPGSIERHARMSYSLDHPEEPPKFLTIDWQEANYPYPETAQAAAIRYVEAVALGVQSETGLLISQRDTFEAGAKFTRTALAELLKVSIPPQVTAEPYLWYEAEKVMLLDVSYEAPEQAHTFMAVEASGNTWKVIGASASFAENLQPSNSGIGKLITLNQPVDGSLGTPDDIATYRFTLPEPGSVVVTMNSRASTSTKNRFDIRLAPMNDIMPTALISMNVAGNVPGYTSPTIWLDSGEYILQLLKGEIWEGTPYQMQVSFEANEFGEAEPNGTRETGTELPINRTLHGLFGTLNDADWYTLTLPTHGILQLTMGIEPNPDSKSARENARLTLYDGVNVIQTSELASPSGVANAIILRAGTYKLLVENPAGLARRAYTIRANFEEAIVENESNVPGLTVTPIPLDTKVAGALQTAGDIDQYRFTVPEPGTVAINLTLPKGGESSRTYFKLTVADASGQYVMHSMAYNGDKANVTVTDLYLNAGDYIAQVEKGGAWTSGIYTIEVNLEKKGGLEQEPNDILPNSTLIGLNQNLVGLIGISSDVDVYRIDLPHDGILQLGLTFAPLESTKTTYTLDIIGNSGVLLTTKAGGKESDKVTVPICLPTGTYYVQVRMPNWVRQPYNLRTIYVEADEAEAEPNGTLAEAAPLLLGAKTSGSLTTEEDADVYRLDIDDAKTVRLDFSYVRTASEKTLFFIEIESGGSIRWKSNGVKITGQSGGFSLPFTFPQAGTYYVRVKPVTWSSTVYTIGIE
jgi:hypothetical protein